MKTRQISFPIQGMFCARCAVELERSLAQLDGVIGACVNYATERATVLYDPARVHPCAFIDAVKQAKFSSSLEQELTTEANRARLFGTRGRRILPILTGFGGGLALIGLYVAILSLAQSPSHALEQLSQDRFWVGLVALGFGTQIGLYTYLRLIVSAMKLAGATAITGAGTGASTLGMLACCAHHLADIAPLVTLTGASGLSGGIAFLADYKIPFILFGLAMNAIGIIISLRTIRRERTHLQMMEWAAEHALAGAPAACHS